MIEKHISVRIPFELANAGALAECMIFLSTASGGLT